MRGAAAILSLVLLASYVALAQDNAQLAIDDNPAAVKKVALQVLREAGYSLITRGSASIVFAKEMTGKARFFTLYALSPASCDCIAPRLYLTLGFSKKGHATLATISAKVEHTALVEHVAESPVWMVPHTISSCDTVREVPIFIRTERLLDTLLEAIRSKTEALPAIRPGE